MKVEFYKSSWGLSGTVREKCEKIAAGGYEGIEEVVLPEYDPKEFRKALDDNGLKLISINEGRTLEEIEEWLQRIVEVGAVIANMQTGREDMTWDEGCAFLEGTLKLQEKYGITIAHETHRKFLFFNPWDTAAYLQKFPELRVTADFSHWVVVTESMLEKYGSQVEITAKQALHLHARVGHEECPQVSDPRAPEFQSYVEQYEKWWDIAYNATLASGAEVMYVDTEFGSDPYQTLLPYTKMPVASQWDICLWMTERLRKRWNG